MQSHPASVLHARHQRGLVQYGLWGARLFDSFEVYTHVGACHDHCLAQSGRVVAHAMMRFPMSDELA